ncbi:MAG: hypothetical protein ACKVQQ_18455, partial [Burkholderiales bacterium]
MSLKPFIVAALAALALPALAHTTPAPAPGSAPAPNAQERINKRQANQDRRIDQGVQSGALTQKEATRLERGQARVDRMEQKAGADGTITRKEAVRIEHAQDRQSRHIKREKHDRQHD